MNVLITGSDGFIGKNLRKILSGRSGIDEVLLYDRANTFEELELFCERADCVFHFAAVLRPESLKGFEDNIDLTSRIITYLKEKNNKCPVMFASSIQADLDNPYGECKRIEEKKLIDYGKESGVNTYIFRFPNLFGTMSRPNYTSVVATFCYNTVAGRPITVNSPATQLKLAFVEGVLKGVTDIVLRNSEAESNRILPPDRYYKVGLGELAYYMQTLKSGTQPEIPRTDDFYDKLSLTYKWYEDNCAEFE